MENFDELKSIWQEAVVSPKLNAAQLVASIKKQRRQRLIKDTLGVLLLIATMIYLVWISCTYQSRMLSTRIGEMLVVLAVSGAAISRTHLLHLLLKPVNDMASNTSYLEHLKRYKRHQVMMHTGGISLYFLVLSAGLALYMYEFVHGDLRAFLLAYGLAGGWILFAWFYLRPRTARKQTMQLNQMVSEIEQFLEVLRNDNLR